MGMFAGLDVGGNRTAVCVVDEGGRIVWQGMVDTHSEMIAAALKRWRGKLAKVGLESGPFTPHLHRSLAAMDFPMVCMDARRAADAIKSRRVKSDKADAWALAEMLRTGWFTPVHVKTIDSHCPTKAFLVSVHPTLAASCLKQVGLAAIISAISALSCLGSFGRSAFLRSNILARASASRFVERSMSNEPV